MDIKSAKALLWGSTVHYPEDRGEPAGSGRVVNVGTVVHKNIHGVEYIWVVVRYHKWREATWPSNRLS